MGREKPQCCEREGAPSVERSQEEQCIGLRQDASVCGCADSLGHTWSTFLDYTGRGYFPSQRTIGLLGTMEQRFNSRRQRCAEGR